ncbi:unnamed protein product [Rhodiola kirilowii]
MAAMNQGLWAPLSGKKKADVDYEELNSLEKKAHSTIMLCLVDDVITEIADEDTVAGLWLKLESLYMTKSLTNKLLLKQRLFSLRMQEGTPLRDHVDQLNLILLDLRDIDVKIACHWKMSDQPFTPGKSAIKFLEKRHWKNECPKKQKQQGDGSVAVNDVNSEKDLDLLANEQPHYNDACVLYSGASDVCKVVGIGSIRIQMHDGSFCTLNEVRHVPQMTKNLISLSLLVINGFSFRGKGGVMHVCKGSQVVLKGAKRGTIYLLQGSTLTGYAAVRDLLGGYRIKNLDFCEHCVFGKLHRSKFLKGVHRTKGSLDYIHSDCWGPARVESAGGNIYFVSFIDDYSRMTWFNEFCKTEGIARHHTVRDTPQQNGVAERMNQTLLERARCMLSNAGLLRRFWAEAVSTAWYLINRGPHTCIGSHPMRCDLETGSVDKQVELQTTLGESESQHQGGEDQHAVREVDMPESDGNHSHLSKTRQHNIALDRARRVGVRPPKRYDFEDMVGYALQTVVEVDIHKLAPYGKFKHCLDLLNEKRNGTSDPKPIEIEEETDDSAALENLIALSPHPPLLPSLRPLLHTRFLWYAPHSGFSNQLSEFKNAILMSAILNRTLVVPPVLDHHAVALGTYSIYQLKQCGSLLSGDLGNVDKCLYAVQDDCRSTVWTYQQGGEDGALDSFQPDEQLRKKKNISYVRIRKDVYKTLQLNHDADSAMVLTFGSLFTAPYKGSESYIDIHEAPKDLRIQSVLENIEYLPFASEIIKAGKEFAQKVINAQFLCAQLRLLDGQFKNHWKSTFLALKEKVEILKKDVSLPLNIFIMTDLPERNWSGSYLGYLAKDDRTFKLHILRENEDIIKHVANRLLFAGHSEKFWSFFSSKDTLDTMILVVLPDVLLYVQEVVCSCASLGFVGTSGSTIAESIEIMRKHRSCSIKNQTTLGLA